MFLVILKYFFALILLAFAILIGYHLKCSSDFDNKMPGKLIPVGFYGQKLHFYCKGPKNSKYSVIFVHGMGQSFADFTNVQLKLEKKGIFSCSYDRPGYGFSSKPEHNEVMDLKMQMDLLNQVLKKNDFLPKDSKVILVGHSMGGLLSLYYSNKYKDDVNGLVLLDPSLPMFSNELSEKCASLENFFLLVEYLGKSGIMRHLVKPNENVPTRQQNENFEYVLEFLKRGQTFEMANKEFKAWKQNANKNIKEFEANKNINVIYVKPNIVIKNPMLDDYTNNLIYAEMQNFYTNYLSSYPSVKNVEVGANHMTMLFEVDTIFEQVMSLCTEN